MQRSPKDEVMPVRVWRPEGWKQRRAPGAPIWLRIGASVARALSIPFRPFIWVLDRVYLKRFQNEVIREFEGSFPGRTSTVVRSGTTYGYPFVVIDLADLRIEMWTHMGEYGGSVDAVSSAENMLADEAIHGKSFGSTAEVAEAVARAVRQKHAEHKVPADSAQANDLR
jgi:hypothetical protein